MVEVVSRTTNAWDRCRGLLGRPPLATNQGLLIVPCASVHMFFMRYAIDVVFLDRSFTVTRVVADLKPWRAALDWGAHMALELPSGAAKAADLVPGRDLVWQAR